MKSIFPTIAEAGEVFVRALFSDHPAIRLCTFSPMRGRILVQPSSPDHRDDDPFPVLLIEPRASFTNPEREPLIEALIHHGFGRLTADDSLVRPAAGWAATGLLHGDPHDRQGMAVGLTDPGRTPWLCGQTSASDNWLAGAALHGATLVIYGARLGGLLPAEVANADRYAELQRSREAGAVVAAVAKWQAWPATLADPGRAAHAAGR